MDVEKLAQIFEAVQVLPLRPTDKIVVKVGAPLSDETAARIKRHFEEQFDGHPVIVLSGGVDLQIIRPEADGRN